MILIKLEFHTQAQALVLINPARISYIYAMCFDYINFDSSSTPLMSSSYQLYVLYIVL